MPRLGFPTLLPVYIVTSGYPDKGVSTMQCIRNGYEQICSKTDCRPGNVGEPCSSTSMSHFRSQSDYFRLLQVNVKMD